MRQAMSLARWADMFDAAKHMKCAEYFLGKHMRLMVTVRPRLLSVCMHADSAWAAVARHGSGVLQGDLKYHESTGYDILFECWAVADRLNFHAVAADCEWAVAQLWKSERVYMRDGLDLSPGALQRIARSLCVGPDAARNMLPNVLPYGTSHINRNDVRARISKCLDVTASAQTMMEWRMSREG